MEILELKNIIITLKIHERGSTSGLIKQKKETANLKTTLELIMSEELKGRMQKSEENRKGLTGHNKLSNIHGSSRWRKRRGRELV